MKYKQILAAILAVDMLVYPMPVGAAENSTNHNETNMLESRTSSGNQTTGDSKNTTEQGTAEDASKDTEKSEDASESEENTEEGVPSDTKTSDTEETETPENTAGESDEANAADDTETDQTDVQETAETGYLDITQFKGYDSAAETITIQSAAAFILLSYCNPEDIKNITINFTISGDVNLTSTVKANEVSSILPDVTTTVQEYSFQGIGTAECPFEGKITGSLSGFICNTTLFGGLSSKATTDVGNSLSLKWRGNGSVPMLASTYQFDSVSTDGHTLPFTISADTSDNKVNPEMGSLLGVVKASQGCKDQILDLGKDIVTYGNNVKVTSATENAGLICNTLESGNISISGYNLPQNAYTVQSTSTYDTTNETTQSAAGNAGGFIGVMEKGTTLTIKSALDVPNGIKVTSEDGNAGGLVGWIKQGAKIITEKNATVTLTNPTITGGTTVGGIAGRAEDELFLNDDLKGKITVTKPSVVDGKGGSRVGGMVGEYTLNATNLGEAAMNGILPSQIEITEPTLTAKDQGFAGGYFGKLSLNGTISYTIAGTPEQKKEVQPTYANCSTAEAVGAIAGKVTSTTIASTLQIQNVSVNANNTSGINMQYHGGLIGELGTKSTGADAVYLNVSNAEIKVENPSATDSAECGFGGATGLLAQGSILQITDITIVTPDNNGNVCGTSINRGGGLVGYAEKSVLNLSGTTDLSGVGYAKDSGKNNNDPKTGWIVGRQESALIYANGDGNGNGWKYIRGKEVGATKQAMNDIGNYGQIIRLNSNGSTSKLSNNLISISTNHVVEYNPSTEAVVNGDMITIGSVDAFALLSVAWNTRGFFGGVPGITSDSYATTSPRTKNITLSSDIDLTGSGITGLSRDVYGTDDIYTGIFNGDNHTVTLAIGETFGYKQDDINTLATEGDDGYGEVIAASANYHGRQGLFATVGTSTIQSLTVDGSVYISNAGKDILAGGIAGELSGKNSNIKTSGVTVKEKIVADCTNDEMLMAGGFFGGSYDYGIQLEMGEEGNEDTLNVAETRIEVNNCTKNNSNNNRKINVGGVIGEVGESTFTLIANRLKVSGSINSDAQKRAYVGGVIGVIKGGEVAANHKIEIKKVSFDKFTITAQNATEVCGGLFGSIWSNVEVILGSSTSETKLDVINAEIKAPKAASVGGLAYRSSGKWEVPDQGINLEKLNIQAGKDVGLLVCRGEKATEQVATTAYQGMGALYLCTTKHWSGAYQISQEKVSITTNQNGVFDEFVAYTTSASDKIFDNNVNGVISIATEDSTADGKTSRVGVDTAGCTTYKNRTTYGKSHQTNTYNRYYYDLDQCITDVKDSGGKGKNGRIDTPQELMLWSVYNYAGNSIKTYFTAGNDTDVTKKGDGPWAIGGVTTMNMTNYSYYPIKYEGNSVNVTETNLIFNNEQIETIEKNNSNKSTQGTNALHSQHYAMHCGLFLTYQSGNQKKVTMTVRKVTFSGSIGKINNSTSGVLVSEFAAGYLDGNTAKEIGITIEEIILDGLKVYECGEDYAPLLINNIGNRDSKNYTYGYAAVDVTGVTIKDSKYTKGTPIASSLIGTVGSSNAKQINLKFQKIVLPDKKANGTSEGGIFSHATLLESFAYHKDDNTSGATYNFNKAEDWPTSGAQHQVTYGKEITGSTEFSNPEKQRWYYDEATWGTDDGLVYNDIDNQKGFDASAYLPYVSVSYDQSNCTHEIKVNHRVVSITEGCGTYEHPYRIRTEAEMNVLSDYMATGEPSKEWRVTVTADQDTAHTADNAKTYAYSGDITYEYDGNNTWEQVEKDADGNWKKVTNGLTIGKNFMRDYLLNAYYDIQGTAAKTGETSTTGNVLALNNFKGFGTDQKPFRGVLTSTNGTTIVLKGSETGNGLIPYSYGSVVKNLNISYEGTGKTLTYEDTSKTLYYPQVCFGGIIGCVLGGDNIIDNVDVKMSNQWLSLSGAKKHLIQVGGYVGSVSGGGVIFRNMTDKNVLENAVSVATEQTQTQLIPSITENATTNSLIESADQTPVLLSGTNSISGESSTYLYVNPYVGRVLDGFAFYEAGSTGTTGITNTNKNYKINTISTKNTNYLTMDGNTVTVNDVQDLLLLSAIVNSGAASGGKSSAYNNNGTTVQYTASNKTTVYSFGGSRGKVRNADYSGIGTANEDAKNAIAEEKNAPADSNLPYLIHTYCGGNQPGFFSLAMNQELTIQMASNGEFDLTTYGNGYQGIAARYVSNAVNGSTDMNNPEGVIPELKSFNGNNSTVIANVQMKEYTDDDFHAASVGGVFNILRIGNAGNISDLHIGKEDKSTKVSLEYCKASEDAEDTWMSSTDVGVGAFAGSLVGYTSEAANRDITVNRVQVNQAEIKSPASAGGIFGNTGKLSEYTGNSEDKLKSKDIAVLIQPQENQIAYGITFNDCSYTDLGVSGRYAAGGFAGYLGNKNQNPRSSVMESANANVGKNSTILATDNSSWAGGLFGYVGTRMFINMTDGGGKESTKATLQNVDVTAGTAAGGCIGYIDEKCYGIHNVEVKGTGTSNVQISLNGTAKGTFYTGGIVGYAKGALQNWTPGWTYAGGISESSITNVQVNDSEKSSTYDYSGSGQLQTNYIAGGMAGQIAGGSTRIDTCTVNTSKIYGSVAGGMTGQTDSQMEFIDCMTTGDSEQTETELKGFSTAGGILGFWTGGQTVTIQGCSVRYLNIEGKDWGTAALIGDAATNSDGSANVGTLYLYDSSAKDSKVTALGNKDNVGGRWPHAGSIIGNLRNTITASNVLISGITLDVTNGSQSNATKGLLFGTVTSDSVAVNIAGISIQNVPDTNKNDNLSGSGSVTSDNDYIAFADYSGTASTDQAGKSTDLFGYNDIAASKPYVVTSPKSSLVLYESETDTTGKYLYSDGASWSAEETGGLKVKAQEIWENKDKDSKEHYSYSTISKKGNNSVTSFDFASVISTYNANQSSQKADTDFPVLQVNSGNTDVIKDYLNILTNGGFSAANNPNASADVHVSATATTYEYKNGKFVKSTDTASLKVQEGTWKTISFAATTSYDNEKNRFTLLTVTFTEGKHSYHVQVPIVVRRMLEMNFTATLSYGTNYQSTDYDSLKSHVLENFGSPITGYLTYTYNSDENSEYADFGWQSYINAGGNVADDMKKSIYFSQGNVALPNGTQLSLIDCRDDKVYYYTVDGTEDNTIPLSSFKASDGKTAYQEPSIAELLHATAKETSGGLFVETDVNGKVIDAGDDVTYAARPTVRIGNKYYRLAADGETGKYTIEINEENLQKEETSQDGESTQKKIKSTVSENYYLVINVPEGTESQGLNGSIQTAITTSIPYQMHYSKRQGGEDGHSNTASTYILSKGYQQTLEEKDITAASKKLSTSDTVMKVDVVNTITFPNDQAYLNEGQFYQENGVKDELYQRFTGGLQKTIDGKATSEQFPTGATGTANFYVYTGEGENRIYYKYENGIWSAAGKEEQTAISYPWVATNGSMELPLSTDGTNENAISLQKVRDLVKGTKSTESSTFYVEVKMDVVLPASGLGAVPEITAAGDGINPDKYTKFVYNSQLSTEKNRLTYSTNRASCAQTTTAYYRDQPVGTKLTYESDQISQLGINLLDLQYLDASREHSLIDTTASYDMSSVQNLEEVLKNSKGIKFTLNLQPKKKNAGENQEDYSQALTDAKEHYLDTELKTQETVENSSYENGVWSWTVPKSEYWDGQKLKTDGVFNGSILTQAIQLKVNVTDVQLFSNYRVTLTADILDQNGTPISGTHADDNIIYTVTKIKIDSIQLD